MSGNGIDTAVKVRSDQNMETQLCGEGLKAFHGVDP